MLTEQRINVQYADYIASLQKLGIDTEKLIEFLGEDRIKNSPMGMEASSGLAFPGALLFFVNRSIDYAKKIYKATSNTKEYTTTGVDENGNPTYLLGEDGKPIITMVNDYGVNFISLIKVMLLHHIGKVMYYVPNDDEWQINKRGILYKWADNLTILKAGERAQFICQKCGIELTEEEFEAMKINDKNDEDRFSMMHVNPLSMLVKMADDLTFMKVNCTKRK